MRGLTYHDDEAIFEIMPDGQIICRCPHHIEAPMPTGLAKRLKSLMAGRTRCKTREIMVPEDFWFE